MLTSIRLSSLSLGLRSFPLLALFVATVGCGVGEPVPDTKKISGAEQTSACAVVDCGPGERCELREVTCVTTPCEPQPVCVAATPVVCGGLLGLACPGAGSCVDDPQDSCDPERGGRDCRGLCECAKAASCTTGHWDSSPSVCACVP